jgi:hypothetical protein
MLCRDLEEVWDTIPHSFIMVFISGNKKVLAVHQLAYLRNFISMLKIKYIYLLNMLISYEKNKLIKQFCY